MSYFTINKRVGILFLSTACSIGLWAQNDITAKLQLVSGDNAKYPVAGNSAVEGATAEVTINVSRRELTNVDLEQFVSATVTRTYNGETKTIKEITADFSPFPDVVTLVTNESQNIKYNITYHFQTRTSPELAWVDATPEEKEVSTPPFNIYAKPTITWGDDGKEKCFKTARPITITPSDGYTAGWRFTSDGGAESATAPTSIPYPESRPSSATLNIKAISYAPDGKTEWYVENSEHTYSTYFYDEPQVNTDGSKSEVYFYKNTNGYTWKVNHEGGDPDGWTIEWIGGNNPEKSSKDFCAFTADVESTKLNEKIQVKVTNKHGEKTLYEEQTIPVSTINVYKKISVPQGTQEYHSYAGDPVSFTPGTEDGGYTQGWSYSWSVGENEISKTKKLQQNPTGTTTYSLNAVNTLPNGVRCDSIQYDYQADVYTLPECKVTYDYTYRNVNNEETSGGSDDKTSNRTTPNPSDDPEYLMVTDEVKFTADNNNTGVTSGEGAWSWSYTLKKDGGSPTNVSDNSTYAFNPQEAGSYEVKVTIKNGEGFIDDNKNFNGSFTKKFVVLDKPELDTEATEQGCYGTDEVTMTTKINSGTEGYTWKYEWDGDASSDEGTKTITVDDVASKQTPQHTVTATAFLREVERYSGTKKSNITIWPKPSVSAEEVVHAFDKDGEEIPSTLNNNADYTDKAKTGDPHSLVVGDNVDITASTNEGVTDEGAWTCSIKVNGKEVSTEKVYKFQAETAGEYKIDIVQKNGTNLVNPYTSTMSRTYNVYDTPKADLEDYVAYVQAGESYEYDFPIKSNLTSDGWSYKWNIEGDDTQTNKKCTIAAPSEILTQRDSTFSATAQYTCEGVLRYEQTKNYTLSMWPEAKIKSITVNLHDKAINAGKPRTTYYPEADGKTFNIDCFSGDVIDYVLGISGGYGNGWTVRNNTVSVSNPNYVSETYNDKTSYTISLSSKNYEEAPSYTINVVNKPANNLNSNNVDWINDTYTINLRTWQTPTIKEENTDSVKNYYTWDPSHRIDVYAGGYRENDVNFKVSHNFGYTGNADNSGWDYSWKVIDKASGSELNNSTDDTYFTHKPNCTNGSQEKDVIVDVTNHIGNNYALIQNRKYYMIEWAKADIDPNFVVTDVNQKRDLRNDGSLAVRSGNKVKISTAGITNGFWSSYFYEWYVSGQKRENQNEIELSYDSTSDSSRKGTSTSTISNRNYIVGPYSHEWDTNEKTECTVTIYNRPKTPETLVKKGSGASGTLICTTTVTDADLEGKDYYLTFEYEDASGTIHTAERIKQANPGQVRWSHDFSASEVNNNSNKFYVYATWVYDNGGPAITSGKRYIGGNIDEYWDGSLYNGGAITRAGYDFTETGIADIWSEDGATVRVYKLDGTPVDKNANMRPGIYIRETMLNGVKSAKKFVVK